MFTRYHVFGWIIHHKALNSGERYTIQVTDDIDTPEKVSNVWLWTKGSIKVVNRDTGEAEPVRRPGDFSLDRPGYRKGLHDYEALEDAEFWCINAPVNNHDLPKLTPVRLKDGESLDLAPDTRILICAGSLRTPENYYGMTMALHVGETASTVTAQGDTYCLIFDRDKK